MADRAPSPASDIPHIYSNGIPMLKVTSKKRAQRIVRLRADSGQLEWQAGSSLKTALLSEAPSFKSLSFESILELRFAADARNYRQQFNCPSEMEDKWMSIIYVATQTEERSVKMLHLVALNDNDAHFWRETLPILVGKHKDTASGDSGEGSKRWSTWIKQCWQIVDADKDKMVGIADVQKLCKQLGIGIKADVLKQQFDTCDKKKEGKLDMPGFENLIRTIRQRPEIESIVQKLNGGKSQGITLNQFSAFLKVEQRQLLNSAQCASLFTKFREESDPEQLMSTASLTNYLLSTENAAFDPNQLTVNHDMSRPLCEYFMSSSHNTYLSGNQFNSDSSAECYVRALQGGCRCVELDVWDGADGLPSVFHGRTLTSRLPFAEALRAINKYAFVTSPYPVMLSVEVHCGLEQQEKMAQQLREILGSALVDDPLPDDDLASKVEMPSPEKLQGRILLKAKLREEPAAKSQSNDRDILSETTTTTAAESSDSELKRRFSNVMRRLKTSSSENGTSPPTSENIRQMPVVEAPPTPKPPLYAPLSSLLVYTVGVKCKGFNKIQSYHPYHVVSLGERRLNKTLKEAATDLLDHNRTHIVRSYPAGFRLSSTNYLPPSLWAIGISVVAINWQTYDLGTEINAAMFRMNGGCGYMLKPDILRGKHPHIKDKEVLASPAKYIVKVTILSAQQLTKGVRPRKDSQNSQQMEGSSLNPMAEVCLLAPGIEASKVSKYRSRVVNGNGFNPVFPNASFEIPFEMIPGMLELAFLRFQILDGGDSDKIIGRNCISLKALRPGYRHLPLYDSLGFEYLFSTLFIKTSLEVCSTSPTKGSPLQ